MARCVVRRRSRVTEAFHMNERERMCPGADPSWRSPPRGKNFAWVTRRAWLFRAVLNEGCLPPPARVSGSFFGRRLRRIAFLPEIR